MKPTVRIVPIADLILDDANPNRHTKRGRDLLSKSLKKLGAGRSVLVDRNNRVIAGNAPVEQAKAAGIKEIAVIQGDGSMLVAHRRNDLDLKKDSRARELSIADNRVAELDLEWNDEVLQELSKSFDLEDLGFTDRELKSLGVEIAEPEAPEPKIDQASELQKKWKTARGQIWQIGEHRLMCGDCTQKEAWGPLMGNTRATMAFTDPPWNVAIGQDSNPRHRQRDGLQNDSLSAVDFQAFLSAFAGNLAIHVEGDLYCVLGASEWPTLDLQLRNCGFHWSATIIWVKDLFVLGRSKYHRRYEPLWYGWHAKGKSSFAGARDVDDVWEIKRPRISEEHPTMKPVELVAKAISNSSVAGDVVCDPFLGGASTMCAAQALGRICYGMEIEPKYVAVALERLSEMGLKPKLLRETISLKTGKNAKPARQSPKPHGTAVPTRAKRKPRRSSEGTATDQHDQGSAEQTSKDPA